jgi:polyferredoxin
MKQPAWFDETHHQKLRRLTKLATLLTMVALPAAGVFRIDLATGSLLIFDIPVHMRNFPAVFGFALMLATGPLLMVTSFGTYWCGWGCPQNTLSEWANRLTTRLLGSRANVDIDQRQDFIIAPSKNRLANWALLLGAFAGASLVIGLVPMFYFFPPSEVLALVTRTEAPQFAQFMDRLYLFMVALVFVNVALVRYFLCNYGCLFRFGSLLFRNNDLPGVQYDTSRSSECSRCNFCKVACVPGLNPTDLKKFDRCINCAECVDACAWLHNKRQPGDNGLLTLAVVPNQAASSVLQRVLRALGWHGAIFIFATLLLGYGLLTAS